MIREITRQQLVLTNQNDMKQAVSMMKSAGRNKDKMRSLNVTSHEKNFINHTLF